MKFLVEMTRGRRMGLLGAVTALVLASLLIMALTWAVTALLTATMDLLMAMLALTTGA